MGELYNLINEFREGNEESFIKIVNRFEPKLTKLSKKISRKDLQEDLKSDLILFTILLLLHKVPLDKGSVKEDKYIVSYISKSLDNEYKRLRAYYFKNFYKEIEIKDTYLNKVYDDDFSDIMFDNMIIPLTDLEKDVIIKKYKLSYRESEIAMINEVSKQAIHKTSKRAISKLRVNRNN